MKVAESLSAFIVSEPENSIAKRVLVKLLPRGTLVAMAVFALASIATEWNVSVMQAATPWILKATEYTNVDPVDGLIVSNVLYIGERVTVSLVEFMLKPLLDAQLKKGEAIGEERGEAAAEARFQEWKDRQMAQGIVFADECEDEGQAENSGQ